MNLKDRVGRMESAAAPAAKIVTTVWYQACKDTDEAAARVEAVGLHEWLDIVVVLKDFGLCPRAGRWHKHDGPITITPRR